MEASQKKFSQGSLPREKASWKRLLLNWILVLTSAAHNTKSGMIKRRLAWPLRKDELDFEEMQQEQGTRLYFSRTGTRLE